MTKPVIRKDYAKNRGWTYEALMLCLDYTQKLERTGMTSQHLYDELKHRVEAAFLGYKQIYSGPGGHDLDKIKLWSKKALEVQGAQRNKLIVEHGSPRAAFAMHVFKLYKSGKLTKAILYQLFDDKYKLAVITKDEDKQIIAAGLHSIMLDTPEQRWNQSKIVIVVRKVG